MIYFTSLFLAVWATTQADGQNLKASAGSQEGLEAAARKLRPALIAGYQPKTVVTDYAAIDQDQASIVDELERESDEGFENAKAIYELGGHSKSYASITLGETPKGDVIGGTMFTGRDSVGEIVVAKSYLTQQTNVVDLLYETADDGFGGTYPECRVGALPRINKHLTSRCFTENGILSATIAGELQMLTYSYDVLKQNKNGRTIQGFSKLLEEDMLDCAKCPYPDAKYAADYYGTPKYSDQWIQAAFGSRSTDFERGNADFSDYGHVGRSEAIKIGAVSMNMLVYAIREFEDAVVDCESNSDLALGNWDEGVALYTGSLEGTSGSKNGHLLHRMADVHCTRFKTCGDTGNQASGTSKVNFDMLALFNEGQNHITNGRCKDARRTKEKIANLMYVPIIQGILYAAYNIEFLDAYQRMQGQGAAFAAAVLPKVHAANKDAAKIIYENMRVGASSTSHRAVKEAFQSVYNDIGVECTQVGGVWDKSLGIYYKGGNPCTESQSTLTTIILGAVGGAVGLGLIGTFFFLRGQTRW